MREMAALSLYDCKILMGRQRSHSLVTKSHVVRSLLNLLIGTKENDGIKPYSIEIRKEELPNLISCPKIANKVMQLVK